MAEAGDRPGRRPLDELVAELASPLFAARHRRRASLRETSPHVNPVMLAGAGRDSLYVNDWNTSARAVYERVGFRETARFATVMF